MTKSQKELLKKEIRTYYESHYEDIKQVAKIFKIKERTLYHYIQTEKWEKGKLVSNIKAKNITNQLLQDSQILGQIGIARDAIKSNMKENAGILYEIYEERILDESANTLILKAMSESFLNTQMLKTALIAQSELNRLASNSLHKSEPDVKVIHASKDVVSMFVDIKKSLYPKESNTQVNIQAILNSKAMDKEQIASLSDDEIRQYLGNIEQENETN